MYQKADAPGEPVAPNLEVSDAPNLTIIPYHVPMKPCSKPKPVLQKRQQEFNVGSTGVAESHQLTTTGWVIASTLSRSENESQGKIPGWAG